MNAIPVSLAGLKPIGKPYWTQMDTLLTLLGLILVLEGIPWFLSPSRVRSLIRRMAESSDASLRLLGLIFMLAGLLLVYLAGKP